MWGWLLWILAWLAVDVDVARVEPVRCMAASAAAYASLAKPVVPAPAPKPEPLPDNDCCGACGGLGYLVMPDGHRVACPCPADCDCKKRKPSKAAKVSPPANCPDGKCKVRR